MISNLVAGLPEVYQPIFGYPELSEQVSRPCLDRLQRLNEAYNALQALLERPLKVLDLGCAQGFFSFSLAERGATVHGVDFLDKNIAVCNALANEHPDLNVSFETGRVEDAIAGLESGQYDIVLGLSVFHHVAFEKGADEVRHLLATAARHSGILLVEVALHEEPLYWGAAQPENPRSFFDSIAFVHEFARHGTHLAPIPRPLYVASNRYWVLNDRAGEFETWSADPHVLARGTHEGSRRYYFGAETVAKIYRFDHPRGAHNRREAERERTFHETSPAGFRMAECLACGDNDSEGWIALQRLPGRLLIDLLREGCRLDRRRVLLEVLDQCAALEAAGLYHDDVRTWNVIVADDGAAWLIDYGSISPTAQDCVWPRNPFLAFFIFVREVATGVVDDPDPLRTIAISPYGLPEPYRAWAISLWQRPLNEWSFALLRDALQDEAMGASDAPPRQPLDAWMEAAEEAMQAQKLFANRLREQIVAEGRESRRELELVVDSHARELGVLGRSLSLLEQLLQDRRGHSEILEKQLEWAHEKLLRAECKLGEMEAQLRFHANRAASADASKEDQRQRAVAAERRADELERQIEDLLRRAVEAEAAAAAQECRAGLAECFIEELQLRVVEAETAAAGLEARVGETGATEYSSRTPVGEVQLEALKRRVVAALMQVKEFQQRALTAETRIGELEYQVYEAEGRTRDLEERALGAEAEAVARENRAVLAEARIEECQRCADAAREVADRAEATVVEMESRLAGAAAQRRHDTSLVEALQTERTELRRALAAAQGDSHYWYQQSEQWHERLLTIHRSSSWKATAPIRSMVRMARGDFSLISRGVTSITGRLKNVGRPVLEYSARAALSRPLLKRNVKKALVHFPVLRLHLIRFVVNRGLLVFCEQAGKSERAQQVGDAGAEYSGEAAAAGRDELDSALTEHAFIVYESLKKVIEGGRITRKEGR